jgi:hypothetical protein
MRRLWSEGTTEQQLMTTRLREFLMTITKDARVAGLEVTNGELFSGPTDDLRDKWLPYI